MLSMNARFIARQDSVDGLSDSAQLNTLTGTLALSTVSMADSAATKLNNWTCPNHTTPNYLGSICTDTIKIGTVLLLCSFDYRILPTLIGIQTRPNRNMLSYCARCWDPSVRNHSSRQETWKMRYWFGLYEDVGGTHTATLLDSPLFFVVHRRNAIPIAPPLQFLEATSPLVNWAVSVRAIWRRATVPVAVKTILDSKGKL